MPLNIFFTVLSVFLCLCSVIFLITSLRIKRNEREANFLRAIFLLYAVWSFFTILLYCWPNREAALWFISARYVGIVYLTPVLFMHVYQQLADRVLTRRMIMLIILTPTINAITVLTNGIFHSFFFTVSYAAPAPSRYVILHYNAGFYIHMAYSYFFVVLLMLFMLRTLFLVPRRLMKPVAFMIAGVCVTALGNILVVFHIIRFPFDITLIFSLITLGVFYLEINQTNYANITVASKERIYNSLTSLIMVLDKRELILDYNKKMEKLLDKLQLKAVGMAYGEFMNCWKQRMNGAVSPYDANIMSVIDETGHERHYNVFKHGLQSDGRTMGYCIEIHDITQIYSLFRFVEESSKYDQLTGLYNRNSYNKQVVDINTPDRLPIGVVFCDVNCLKQANDTYGHLAGDAMLVMVAEAIRRAVPDRAYAARVGGDEFVVLLANASLEELERIVEGIQKECGCCSHEDFGAPCVATGYGIMTQPHQDLKEVIYEADKQMYRDKNDRRRK